MWLIAGQTSIYRAVPIAWNFGRNRPGPGKKFRVLTFWATSVRSTKVNDTCYTVKFDIVIGNERQMTVQYYKYNECYPKKGRLIFSLPPDEDNVVNTPPSTTPNSCADGWTPYWYACYKVETQARTWQEASDHCVQNGAQLVSVHSRTENAAVGLMVEASLPIWIGLKQVQYTCYIFSEADHLMNSVFIAPVYRKGLFINFSGGGGGGGGRI